MARWLFDCRPLCGRPWRLGLASTSAERDAAFRLRYDVFFREAGYGSTTPIDGRDVDAIDDWCDHLILYDTESDRVIGTYRVIHGTDALRHGGLYGEFEFDLSPLQPIVPHILQGGRTCVAAGFRQGPAFQYLSYGMELLLREAGSRYFLGVESFLVDSPATLHRIYSCIRQFGTDPEWRVQPQPGSRVADLREVPVGPADERILPGIIRMDLRMGFRACGPPAWDPDFRSYDLLMLGRRDRLTPFYDAFLARVERNLQK
ncbi:MAG: GNAT family N-acetyltransferase [Gemmataceae bacterium]